MCLFLFGKHVSIAPRKGITRAELEELAACDAHIIRLRFLVQGGHIPVYSCVTVRRFTSPSHITQSLPLVY